MSLITHTVINTRAKGKETCSYHQRVLKHLLHLWHINIYKVLKFCHISNVRIQALQNNILLSYLWYIWISENFHIFTNTCANCEKTRIIKLSFLQWVFTVYSVHWLKIIWFVQLTTRLNNSTRNCQNIKNKSTLKQIETYYRIKWCDRKNMLLFWTYRLFSHIHHKSTQCKRRIKKLN